MKRRAARIVALIIFAASMLASAPTALSKDRKADPAPAVVGMDAVGDWSIVMGAGPVGEAVGLDLVEAALGMRDPKTVNFIITLSGFPSGGIPEAPRYHWDFYVSEPGIINRAGKAFVLSGGYTNHVRGACHTSDAPDSCPRDPGRATFMLEQGDNCIFDTSSCALVGLLEPAFDFTEGTITIPVPLKMLEAGPQYKIEPWHGIYSYLGASFGQNPGVDQMDVFGYFTIPKTRKAHR